MILADKIIQLRKREGLSQEDLAEKMNVSRQAVSKWESAQSLPDIEKILQLSRMFDVTTDYLLKDEIEVSERLHQPSITDDSSQAEIISNEAPHSEKEDAVHRNAKASRRSIRSSLLGGIAVSIYWMLVLTVYFLWSILGDAWHISWLVLWPLGPFLFVCLVTICKDIDKRSR